MTRRRPPPRGPRPLILLVALVIAALPARIHAADATTLFLDGNEAYRTDQFDEAYANYEELVRKAPCASSYFNLGNTAFRLGRLGEAILHYERALRYAPRDPDIRANLEFARSRVKSRPPEVETDVVTRVVWSALSRLAMPEVCRVLTLTLWILALSLTAGILTRHPGRRKGFILVALLAGLAYLLSAGLLGFKLYEFEARTPGIVLQGDVDVLAGPADGQTRKFILQEGHKVLVVEHRPGWCRIALETGANGWIRSETIETI